MTDIETNNEAPKEIKKSAGSATGGNKLAAAALAVIILIVAAGAGGYFIGKRTGVVKQIAVEAAAKKKANAQNNKNVVVRLKNGSVSLTLDQMNAAWLLEPEINRNNFVQQPNWQQYFVDYWVDIAIMTELANRKNLNNSQLFLDTRVVKDDSTLSRLYYQKFIQPEISKVAVSPKDIKDYYDKNKYKDYFIGWRDAFQIIVADKATADSIYESLKGNPAGFEAAARGKSIDTDTAPGGGAMGKIGKDDKRIPPEVYNTYFFTPVGTVSAPVQSRLGWHIVLLKAASPSDMDFLPMNKERTDEIEGILKPAKQQERFETIMAGYKKDLGVEVDSKLVPLIAADWKKHYDEMMRSMPQMQAPMQ